MDKEFLASQAQLLRDQKTHFLHTFRRAEEGLGAIAEDRESELEEHAQEEQSARFLSRLDDRTLKAAREIDAALERIGQGAYGVCENCRKRIAVARLRALPATRTCRRCAGAGETFHPLRKEAEPARNAPIPGDLKLLNDLDMAEAIHDCVKQDGRVDMEELHIVCRNGVVHVSGQIPSETEHQILLHTLTDVLGFEEVVDRVGVETLLWQTERRARDWPPEAEVNTQGKDAPGAEDVFDSHEQGSEFIAPGKPTPDEL